LKILCIGSHPDDVELAMGGTLLRLLEKGNEVLIVDLSNGEPTPYGSIEIRKKESQEVASILGIKRITLNNKNRYIFDTIEAREELAEVFREFQPEIIFTHYEFDTHPDHTSASKLTEAARFYSKLTKSTMKGNPYFPKKIIYYFPNHIHLNLLPSFCVDISKVIDTKIKILNSYHSQFIAKGNGLLIDEIRQINRYFGIRISKEFAEPFFVRETIDLDFFKDLI
jgi:N-acetylglucosamine malate deacetylase 1